MGQVVANTEYTWTLVLDVCVQMSLRRNSMRICKGKVLIQCWKCQENCWALKVWQDRVFRNIKIGEVSKCGGLLQKSLLGQRKYQLLGSFAWCEGLLIGLWLFFCLFTQRQFVYFCYILLYIVIIQWQLCIIIIQWQVVIWTILRWYKSSVWLCVFTCIIWISQTCFFYILRASLSSSHICTRRFIWQ